MEEIDDLDKAASIDVGAASRRSTSSLDDKIREAVLKGVQSIRQWLV